MSVYKASQLLEAEKILSPRELEVAMLTRIRVGRNGIAGALGISVNSVKTMLRRIKNKLGEDWLDNPGIAWPTTTAWKGSSKGSTGSAAARLSC